ncbi:protein FAR1-RELATED SEQUENCE 1-like [Ipomoea triloba]|uniref:protein FAR1-RELATED SEQUENCE 1-like n=1 Tax=Ipomoea triloba TaxID=35885 RepID=UPI00125D77EC|nr:protein FAR1-RELATED SEQUENCE 1-like [Ipomoea triloba]
MAVAISQVFPTSRHRLCIWHIEAEFELYWTREKWCPAFNKDYFSGGILSSQRSESTNHSISRRLSKTAGLCDFYSSFVGVVSEWRSRENGEDVRCSQGVPTMAMDHIKIFSHARDIYTIEIYYLFEEQFLKGASCYQECALFEGGVYKYHAWRPEIDIIRHEVIFNVRELDIWCSCKLFTETGILCCHCVRILNVHCVSEVPNKYIMKRWTKKVLEDENAGIIPPSQCFNVPSSVWTLETTRKFQKLVVYCQENSETRKIFEQAVLDAKRKVEDEYDPIFFEGEDCDVESSSGVIKDPSDRRLKGLRNRRSQVEDAISNIAGNGYLVHPMSGGSIFCHFRSNANQEENQSVS